MIKAQNLIKERKWKEAIESFALHIKEQGGPYSDDIYASYARSLRITGNTDSALEILEEGRNHHPESERILREYHLLYDYLGQWEAARRIAKRLIRLHPQNAEYQFLLGRSESFLSNRTKAKKAYRRALSLRHDSSFEEVTFRVQQGFAENPAEVKSRYVYIDGKNNLGAFIHEYNGRSYFTKISTYTSPHNGAGREIGFYKNLVEEFPDLNTIIPHYIHSMVIDKIAYLTIEMINSAEGVQPAAAKVIQASKQISAVRYQDLAEKYPPPRYVYQFRKGRAISVVHFFTQIHQESRNRKLFGALNLIMKQHAYPAGIRKLVQRLESAIMDHQLYLHIKPDEHYSLLHGDFAFQNLLVEGGTGSIRAIDWTSYTTGPHFIDPARYFSSLLMPYEEIKSAYLEADDRNWTSIEKIFFLYALIVFYFQKLGRKGIESELSDFILPALEDLERAVLKFTSRKDGDSLKDAEMQELQLKIKQLEQENEILREERLLLKKRHEETLNSKSWKITAPLRVFTERRNLKE